MTITTWRRNFRLWSTQLFAVMTALGVLQWGPDVVASLTASLPLWKPVLPQWAFAMTQTVLGLSGVVLRNIKQRGGDTS
ncbi:DUF7940 domain-containing protein [Halomonas sp. V046]|uniref:DUF7940 domain-containing protein n=1 Tax=Halomonas sp. V046 TaxID=3459611 RepID=UPI004043C120